MRELFSFPNPVNEKAARVVAGVVLVAVIVTLATGWYWLLIPVAYGFWARVLTGPTLSPLGWIAQNVIAPRLGEQQAGAGPAEALCAGDGRGHVDDGARARVRGLAHRRRRRVDPVPAGRRARVDRRLLRRAARCSAC